MPDMEINNFIPPKKGSKLETNSVNILLSTICQAYLKEGTEDKVNLDIYGMNGSWGTGPTYDLEQAKKLFQKAKVNSQNISALLKKLGDQDLQIKFFKNYISKFFSNDNNVLIDSTALPSAINSSINAFGYSSGAIEENVTCLMLVDKKSKLPIYFRAIGGSIADVSSLKTTVAEIKRLGLKTKTAILDAGFCSKENLQLMCQEQINFITRLV